jgi:hypothetical protein
MDQIKRGRFLFGAGALFVLLVVPVALAGTAGDSAGPQAKRAAVSKKVKKLTQEVNELQQQLAALQAEQGGARPPTGAAGGDLTGT